MTTLLRECCLGSLGCTSDLGSRRPARTINTPRPPAPRHTQPTPARARIPKYTSRGLGLGRVTHKPAGGGRRRRATGPAWDGEAPEGQKV